MGNSDKFFHGKIQCSEGLQEAKAESSKVQWGYREVSSLYVQEDSTYVGICFEHRERRKRAGIEMPEMALHEQCFHFPWRDVVKLTIHKTDPNAGDRKGDVITLEMKDVPNTDLMNAHAVEVAHGLQLMADKRATVHHLGETGEGNYCWTETGYHWDSPATCVIRDKYWGKSQIVVFRDVCRLMARIHEWELVDETMPLLDRIVKAINDSDAEEATG